MEAFKGRYYNLNRKLFVLIGLWPYGNKRKYVMRTLFMGALIVVMLPHVISSVMNYKNIDRLMINLTGSLTIVTMILKVLGLVLAEKDMKHLYESVANNWLTIQDENERNILHEYSEWARKISTFYTVTMCTAGTTISTLPFVPKILDLIDPLSKPRPSIYLLEGEFFVDREKHFVACFLFDLFTTAVVTVVTVSVDGMYIVSSQHCCALYNIVRYRLSKLSEKVVDATVTSGESDSYIWLIHTVQLHRTALSFTSILSDSFSVAFFTILMTYIVLVPLVACAVLANLDNPLSLAPYAFYFVALMQHLFILFWPGQTILSHGIDLQDAAYCNEWYAASPRTKKLLLIFMQRCLQPASLTAGGLLLMNFETYSSILRTSISYITVLASFR